MDPVLLLVLAGWAGILTLGAAAHAARRRHTVQTWRLAALNCGLDDIESSHPLLRRLQLTGWLGKVRVRFERYNREESDQGTRLLISDLDRGLSALSLRPEDFRTALEKRLGRTEVETGDAAFDEVFYVSGVSSLVLARLDALTRRKLRALAKGWSLELVGGEMRLEYPDSDDEHGAASLTMVLTKALEMVDSLTRPLAVLAGLVENARTEPDPAVRINIVLALAREFGSQPEAQEALRAACHDAAAEVRLRAALALGREGRDTLFELTQSEADDASVARAVLALREELTVDHLADTLRRALRSRCFGTADACLRVLGWRGGDEVVPVLAKVLAVEAGNDLGVAAATALGATATSAAERPLIEALRRENTAVSMAAAAALGHVGSAGAVLPLHDTEKRSRDRDLQRAARQAIAQIQGRLKGASPGQLSIAGADAGQLSVADPDAGQVSLAAEPGRLSLPAAERGRLSLDDPKRER